MREACTSGLRWRGVETELTMILKRRLVASNITVEEYERVVAMFSAPAPAAPRT